MRRLTAAALFLALALPIVRADEKADAAKKLDGSYEVLALIVGGKPDEAKKAEVKSFVIKGGEIVITAEGKEQAAKFTLDPSKKPAHIDIGPREDEKTIKGIYEAKETDKGLELTIAFTKRTSDDRPSDFKGEGDGVMVVKLFRKKDK